MASRLHPEHSVPEHLPVVVFATAAGFVVPAAVRLSRAEEQAGLAAAVAASPAEADPVALQAADADLEVHGSRAAQVVAVGAASAVGEWAAAREGLLAAAVAARGAAAVALAAVVVGAAKPRFD